MKNVVIMTHRCDKLLDYNKNHNRVVIQMTQNPSEFLNKSVNYGI